MAERGTESGGLLVNAERVKTCMEIPRVLRSAVRNKLQQIEAETGERISFNMLVTVLAYEWVLMGAEEVEKLIKAYRTARVSQIPRQTG